MTATLRNSRLRRALVLAALIAFLAPTGASVFAGVSALAEDDARWFLNAPLVTDTLTLGQRKAEDALIDALLAQTHAGASYKLDLLFERYAVMGACVAVVDKGEIVYLHCYGDADAEGTPVVPETGFQVGSIGKMVANLGLAQLLEKRGIGLETELQDILGVAVRNPGWPDSPVTLRQLMTHTAGLRDNGGYQRALSGHAYSLAVLFDAVHARRQFYPNTPPGAYRAYSNFGGGLIGSLIEALSGLTVDQYMKRNIFEPLGITAGYQASCLPADMPLADMFEMPKKTLSKALREDTTNITQPSPLYDYGLTAGKLIISAPELVRLLMLLMNGGEYRGTRVLQTETVLELLTPQGYRGSVFCDCAHGLFINIITDDQVDGRVMYGHGGKANGMLCSAYFDPIDQSAVVMLTNGCENGGSYNDVGMLGREAMRVCYGLMHGEGFAEWDPYLVEE